MTRGCFISVEGVEGVGKSTNIAVIESALAERGITYLTTREPGGPAISEQIRAVLVNPENRAMHSTTELLLMFAARAQQVNERIEPALSRGDWVICDRFTDSTFAYQGGGRGVSLEKIEALNQLALDGFSPDLTILLDSPVEIGLQRARQRGAADRFEQEGSGFFRDVRQQFLDRVQKEPARFRVVDASEPREVVKVHIESLLKQWIEDWLPA